MGRGQRRYGFERRRRNQTVAPAPAVLMAHASVEADPTAAHEKVAAETAPAKDAAPAAQTVPNETEIVPAVPNVKTK